MSSEPSNYPRNPLSIHSHAEMQKCRNEEHLAHFVIVVDNVGETENMQ